MLSFKKLKKSIIFLLLITVFTLSFVTFSACNDGYVEPSEKYTEYVYQAEDARLSSCKVVSPEGGEPNLQSPYVGYLEKDSELLWTVLASEEDSTATIKIKVSCPMAWIGLHNLPQTFDFDKVYTLTVNGEQVLVNRTLYGSSDVTDSGNYYFWVEARTEIVLGDGENQISLKVTNTGRRVYASFGNVDYISIYSMAKLT